MVRMKGRQTYHPTLPPTKYFYTTGASGMHNPNTPKLFTNFCYQKRRSESGFVSAPHEELWSKQVVLVGSPSETTSDSFVCGAAGCRAVFCNNQEYDYHYHNVHRNQCSTCGGVYASKRLLEIHITEFHDPFFAMLCNKQPLFLCFVTECNEKFQLSEDRRRHLVSVHSYPETYEFDEVVRPRTRANDRGRGRTDRAKKVHPGTRQFSQHKENGGMEVEGTEANLPTLSFGGPTGRAFHSTDKPKREVKNSRGKGRRKKSGGTEKGGDRGSVRGEKLETQDGNVAVT